MIKIIIWEENNYLLIKSINNQILPNDRAIPMLLREILIHKI